MRRRTLFIALTIVLALVMVLPSMATAQHRGPGHVVRGPSVVVRGYFGYPYYSPFWGFNPWYPYGYWGWDSWQWGYPGAYYRGGSLRLQVTPKEAQVFVDSYFVGTVDDFDGVFQSLDLPSGGHELVLYLQGYRTVRQSFYVTVGKTFKVAYTMARLGPGETSEPPPQPPARAPEEGVQPPGREPAPVPQAPEPPPPPPPPQPRQPRQPRPAPVEPGQREARSFGTLSIRVQPAGAEVLIDGERWQGPEAEERLLVNVSEGTHRVEIQKAGYVTYSAGIQVRGGETATINVSLPPRSPQGESR